MIEIKIVLYDIKIRTFASSELIGNGQFILSQNFTLYTKSKCGKLGNKVVSKIGVNRAFHLSSNSSNRRNASGNSTFFIHGSLPA